MIIRIGINLIIILWNELYMYQICHMLRMVFYLVTPDVFRDDGWPPRL